MLLKARREILGHTDVKFSFRISQDVNREIRVHDAQDNFGSRGRIRRCLPCILLHSNRLHLSNQANSRTTSACSLTAVCWQFCWQLELENRVQRRGFVSHDAATSKSLPNDTSQAVEQVMGTGQDPKAFLPTNSRIVRRWYYYRDNSELVELSVLRHNRK